VGSWRASRHSLPPQRLNQVLDWIDAHLSEPISLTELAAIAGVETSWFTRLFHRSAGLPPYRYVLHRRIILAQQALRAGMTPAAVAMHCGFVDQAHLTRHFRRIVGVPPAAWAASAR
jgi:AraC family transcriptional regulator